MGRKQIMVLTALFCSVALLTFAARGGGGKRQGRAGGGRKAGQAVQATAATQVAKFVAKDVGLAADKTDKFVAAFVTDRQSAQQRLLEARKTKDRAQTQKALEENRKGLDAVLADSLTADQAKKAREYDLEALEQSVGGLLAANVEEAKVEQAVPVLAKYQKAAAELIAKARAKEISRKEVPDKGKELRDSTAKELEPIIGKDAATTWQESQRMSGPIGKAKGGETRAKGARNKAGAPAEPVTPVAP